MKGKQSLNPALANFFPVHRFLPSWLHTPCWTSMFVLPALCPTIIHSSALMSCPHLPRLPLHLLVHSLSHISSFVSFRLAQQCWPWHWPPLPNAHILSFSFKHCTWLFPSKSGYLIIVSAILCLNSQPQIRKIRIFNLCTIKWLSPSFPLRVSEGRVQEGWLHFKSQFSSLFSVSPSASVPMQRDSVNGSPTARCVISQAVVRRPVCTVRELGRGSHSNLPCHLCGLSEASVALSINWVIYI